MKTNAVFARLKNVADHSKINLLKSSDGYHHPATADELTKINVETIVQLENVAKENLNTAERISEKVAKFCGSMTFVWVHIIWFSVWIIANYLPEVGSFDPFPFTFLTLVVSLEAIFLSTFILISQNQETRITERRNHLALQINLLTEQENTKMLQMLARIAEKLNVAIDDDPTVSVLEQATRPEVLVEQIVQATEKIEEKPEASGTSVLNLTEDVN